MLGRFHFGPEKLDRLLAGGLLVVGQVQIWGVGYSGRYRAVDALLSLLLCGGLAVRRRRPAFAGIGGNAAMALGFWLGLDTQIFGTTIAWFCDIYALTVWTSRRWFAGGLACVAVADLAPISAAKDPSSSFLFGVITIFVMLLVRRVIGDRERRLELAERERDVAAREAVVEERARIARELHDAIAHDVSLIVVQAGAERRTLDDESPTKEVLETVERIGRGALTEMRRLVGMLRSNEGAEPLAPQPRLRDLPMLVTQVREAGLAVELTVVGEPRELPVGLELSAYRIVQEALTNALKHAGEAHATVHVRYAPDSLQLEISDDGGGAAEPAPGGGHGLVGMRERVALYGGLFEASQPPTGGFTVRVALPIQ